MKKVKKGLEIPKIKKKINAFLVGEEGKISKQSLLKAGAVLGGIALSSALINGVSAQQTHANNLNLNYVGGTATVTHGHHASHSSHGSHGSHAQW